MSVLQNTNPRIKHSLMKSKGFTLVELVMVIVLLGVVSVGITGFIKFTAQTFVNVTARDELLSSARFVVERLNREVRNAVPSSIRVNKNGSSTIECLEFTPIIASTTYTDIPVAPETASNEVTAIKFFDNAGNDYTCGVGCTDKVIVYPTSAQDVYTQNATTGKAFSLSSIDTSAGDEWTLTLANNVLFDNESTTKRLYMMGTPVSYCASATEIKRYTDYSATSSQVVPPISTANETATNTALMAKNINNITAGAAAFAYTHSTLQRNALVEIELHFLKNAENIVFNNQMQIKNVP